MSEFRISNKTDYDVRFMPEGNKELLKLTPDGECYWNGRLVESDEDFKAAIISVSKYFIGASQPYHATIDRLTAERDRYKEALEILSSIYFYGNFKPETYNESLLEQMLTQFGLWPTTEDEIIKRSIAREALKEVQGESGA